MDSPSIPRNPDEESDPSLVSLWNFIKPLHKGALCGLVVSLAVGAALGFCSSVPLWRPVGALILQRLWDVLRFLVITTSIVLALLNSRRRRHTSRLNSGNYDSFSSTLPFVGMFHGEVQQLHSYSFNSDKEVEVTEDGRISKTELESDTANAATPTERESDVGLRHDVSAASSSTDLRLQHDVSVRPALRDVRLRYDASEAKTGDDMRPSGVLVMAENFRPNGTHLGEEDGSANAEASRNPSGYASRNAINMRMRGQGQNRRLKSHDDLGLIAVAEEPKHSSSKIIHRRGKSLEFPSVQEGGTSVPCIDVATDVRTADVREKRISTQTAASSPASSVPLHAKKGRGTSSSTVAQPGPEHCNIDTGGIPRAASKHSRSQSAYNVNEFLVQQGPRSKSGTAISTSELSKRRNVSLSCDLDREYSKGGVPAWLSSVPSPPTPPLIYGYGGDVENIGEVREGNMRDDSSLRRAYTESLAPWRAAANTVPVDISTNKRKEASTRSHQNPTTREKKTSARMDNSSPPSSDPSTPISMGSPSPSELNKKVDAFIARFHDRMRLQRLESIERAKQRGI